MQSEGSRLPVVAEAAGEEMWEREGSELLGFSQPHLIGISQLRGESTPIPISRSRISVFHRKQVLGWIKAAAVVT